MAKVISQQRLRAPENRATVRQAISLIQRGKTYAAFGDPRMQRFINTLEKMGVRELTQLQKDVQARDDLPPQSSVQRYVQEKVLTPPPTTPERNVVNIQEFLRQKGFQTKPTSQVLPASEVSTPATLPPVQGPKKVVQPVRIPGERYDPRLGAFTGVSPTGPQGSVYMRPPTITERELLVGGDNVLTVNRRELDRRIQEGRIDRSKVEILEKTIERMESGNIDKEGNWIGSDEGYSAYKKVYKEYKKELSREKGTIGVGFFGDRVSIDEFDPLEKPVSSASAVIGKTIGTTLGGASRSLGLKEKKIMLPGEIGVFKKVTETAEKVITGDKITVRDYLKPATVTVTPERIAKVGEKTVEFGKYVVPYVGTAIYAGEVIERVNVAGGVGQFVMKNPVESGLLLAGGTFLASSKLLKGFRKPIVQAGTKEGEIVIARQYRTLFRKAPKEGKELRVIKRVEVDPKKVFVEKIGMTDKEGKIVAGVGEDIIIKGEKAVVTVPKKRRWLQFDEPERVIYEGNPFGKAGAQQRKEVLKDFKALGIDDKQAKSLLQLKSPVRQRDVFVGRGKQIAREGEEDLYALVGKVERRSVKGEVGGIKLRQKRKEVDLFAGLSRKVGQKDGVTAYEYLTTSQRIQFTKEGRAVVKLGKEAPVKVESGITLLEKEKDIGQAALRDVLDVKAKKPGMEIDFGDVRLPTSQIFKEYTLGEKPAKLVVATGQESVTDGVKRFVGSGKKSSQEYLQNLYSPEAQLLVSKAIKKTPTKTPKPTGTVVKMEAEVPVAIESRYAGTGLYERTEETASVLDPRTRPGLMLDQKIQTRVPTAVKVVGDLDVKTKTDIGVGVRIRDLSRTQQPTKIDLGDKVKESIQQAFKSKQKTDQALQQKTAQLLVQKTKQQLKSPRIRPPKLPKVPKPKVPKIPIPSGQLQRLAKGLDSFEAFGFKSGKAKKVATGTKEEVTSSLRKFLRKDLSASGFVREKTTGKKVSFQELSGLLGSEFRAGKSDPFKVVEKKSKRLRRGGTGRGIQAFRKGKIKGFSFGGL